MKICKILCVVCACMSLFFDVSCACAEKKFYFPSIAAEFQWMRRDLKFMIFDEPIKITERMVNNFVDALLDDFGDDYSDKIAVSKNIIDDYNAAITYFYIDEDIRDVVLVATLNVESAINSEKAVLAVMTFAALPKDLVKQSPQ